MIDQDVFSFRRLQAKLENDVVEEFAYHLWSKDLGASVEGERLRARVEKDTPTATV